MPGSPQERSGLVVLRVAGRWHKIPRKRRSFVPLLMEICLAWPLHHRQMAFGTQILLRNIRISMGTVETNDLHNENSPDKTWCCHFQNAVRVMNTIQTISMTAANLDLTHLHKEELLQMADLYRILFKWNWMTCTNFCHPRKKGQVVWILYGRTEYEKKIAEGTYNPDLDGILLLDWFFSF